MAATKVPAVKAFGSLHGALSPVADQAPQMPINGVHSPEKKSPLSHPRPRKEGNRCDPIVAHGFILFLQQEALLRAQCARAFNASLHQAQAAYQQAVPTRSQDQQALAPLGALADLMALRRIYRSPWPRPQSRHCRTASSAAYRG